MSNKNLYNQTVAAFTFMEVLVALALLTFMLLTVAALQLTLCRRAQQLHWQTVALQQLDNMLATVAVGQSNLNLWNRENAQRLPQGVASWQQGLLLLQWRSDSGVWNCPNARSPHFSCFAVMVS